MATVVVINPDSTDPTVQVRGALKDKRGLLEKIGVLMEEESQQAFQRQRLGDFAWEPRYPNQGDPFINVAGAVDDFARGSVRPRSRRFQRRPALRDTGQLQRSIRSRVSGDDKVEVGTNLPYAANHQFGLVSTQTVDKSTKQRIAAWLLTDQGREYRPKMVFLLNPNTNALQTETVQRPFLGVTTTLEADIAETVEEHVSGLS